MKSKLLLILAATLITTVSHAAAPKILPDSCGPTETKFDVKTKKGTVPAAADTDKAQVILILNSPGVPSCVTVPMARG